MRGLRPETPAETASTDAGAPATAEELATPTDLSRLQVPAGEPEAMRSTSSSSADVRQGNADHFLSVRRETRSTVAGDHSVYGDINAPAPAESVDAAIHSPPQPRDTVDTDAKQHRQESVETRLTGLETALTGITSLLHSLSDQFMGRAGVPAATAAPT
eukprot:SAG31_NODE_15467_length_753_cov_2.845566_1_plen_158_part_01